MTTDTGSPYAGLTDAQVRRLCLYSQVDVDDAYARGAAVERDRITALIVEHYKHAPLAAHPLLDLIDPGTGGA